MVDCGRSRPGTLGKTDFESDWQHVERKAATNAIIESPQVKETDQGSLSSVVVSVNVVLGR